MSYFTFLLVALLLILSTCGHKEKSIKVNKFIRQEYFQQIEDIVRNKEAIWLFKCRQAFHGPDTLFYVFVNSHNEIKMGFYSFRRDSLKKDFLDTFSRSISSGEKKSFDSLFSAFNFKDMDRQQDVIYLTSSPLILIGQNSINDYLFTTLFYDSSSVSIFVQQLTTKFSKLSTIN